MFRTSSGMESLVAIPGAITGIFIPKAAIIFPSAWRLWKGWPEQKGMSVKMVRR
jgi:hypothetical protein